MLAGVPCISDRSPGNWMIPLMEAAMLGFIVLSVVFVIAVVIFHYCAICKGPRSVVISKGIASLIFVLIGGAGLMRYSGEAGALPVMHYTLFAGLVLGFAGDILLALRNVYASKKSQFIVFGIIAFALGHICYSILTFDGYSTELAHVDALNGIGQIAMLGLPFVLSAAIASVIVKTAPRFNVDYGKLKPGVLIYTCIILVFVTSAILWSIFLYTHTGALTSLWLIVPVLLFSASDYMLSMNYFDKAQKHGEPRHIIAIHVTYYLAQYMFASYLYWPAISMTA